MDQLATNDSSLPENLSARVYSDLRQKLIVGDLRPAETLSIRTLAESYHISAMPVREALRQLASENALIGAVKKAYRVPDLNPAEAANLFFIRAVLEGAAAEVAAKNISDADFPKLEESIGDMALAWKKQNASAFLLANFRFHSHVHSLTRNNALQSIIEGLFVRTGPWLAHGIVNLVNPDSWMGEHTDIVAALRSRDGTKARRLMKADADWGMQLYKELS